METGYLSAEYAASLSERGAPRLLPQSGGWILERKVPGTDARDATGCYPLFACRDWSQLGDDLAAIGDRLVSLALVTDPFGAYDASLLRGCFKDVVVPFKEHFVVELKGPPELFVHAHHRRNARKALRLLDVERCDDPVRLVDEWSRLYAELIERHAIRGMAAFSRASFARQLAVPGMVVFRALRRGETIGMLLWYVQEERAYYHLGAYSEAGYRMHASFALFWRALEYFHALGLRWLNLGGGAGLTESAADDGLTRFKRGWATATRTAYFCGRIFDRPQYDRIVAARGLQAEDYFPAYRKGEFGYNERDE